MFSPAELFEVQIERKIQAPEYQSTASALNAVYQFNISGDRGGMWSVNLHDRHVYRGEDPLADCTLSLSDSDLHRFIEGEVTATSLVLRRKLTISGKYSLALKLRQIFSQHGRA